MRTIFAARGKRRVQHCGLHRIEIRIAVRAIHNRVKLGVQRDAMPADRNLKVRRIGLAFHFNASQRSPIFSGGRQNPTDAPQRSQIRIREGVVAHDSGVARTFFV